MNSRIVNILTTGIIGGGLVGFVIGAFVLMLTSDYVINQDDIEIPTLFEQAQSRYIKTILSAFTIVFAAIGPLIATGKFSPWIRHAIYGQLAVSIFVTAITLIAASLLNQQPFNMHKGASSLCIDFARYFAIPIALIIGPIIGIQCSKLACRDLKIVSPDQSDEK